MGILKPGTAFAGRYEIVRILSAGGMGAVYEVVHQETRRHLALKVMLPSALADDDIRERFRREASVTSTVESEHIVEVLDAGVEEATGSPFLVMELLRGEDLGKRLRANGPMEPAEAIELFTQLARGLARTHEANIVHRDLKPENIFLTKRDDGSMRAKILDFGIAKLITKTQGTSTRSLGTPLFMSPEQMEGVAADIGPATDLYALGHVAFAVLCGKAYYQSDADEADNIVSLLLLIAKGSSDPATARAATYGVRLPDAFDAWFVRCTHRDPTRRFASVGEMVSALATVFDAAQSDASSPNALDLRLTSSLTASTPPNAGPAHVRHATPAPPRAAGESIDDLALALTSPVASAEPTANPGAEGERLAPLDPEPIASTRDARGAAIADSPGIDGDGARSGPTSAPASSRSVWLAGGAVVVVVAAIAWSLGNPGAGTTSSTVSAAPHAVPDPSQGESFAPSSAAPVSSPPSVADLPANVATVTATASGSARAPTRPTTTARVPTPEIVRSPDGR